MIIILDKGYLFLVREKFITSGACEPSLRNRCWPLCLCFRDDNRQEERHTVRLWGGQVVPSRGVLPKLPQGGLQSPVPTVRVSSTEPRKKQPVVCMYMSICSYLPILNTLTRIFIPIPPSLNTNSSIFVACHFPRKFWF